MSGSPKLIPTKTPGIYKKEGAKTRPYVVKFRAAGKQCKRFTRTLDEARRIKRQVEADRDRGEFQPQSRIKFREFLSEWIDRYQGNRRRGFRENTRNEYRRLLDQYAHRYFGERLRLCDVTPHQMAQFVSWLADPIEQGKALRDGTIKNAVAPVSVALGTAQREGLIRHNPADNLAMPSRSRPDNGEEEEVKALSREQLRALLALTPQRYRLLFELLASTGLRISEAVALQSKHLHLGGANPHIRVRRAIVRGRVEAPKTRHAKRSVPLPAPLVFQLRSHLAALSDQSAEALVFPSERGTPLDPDNLRKRTFKPLAEEVGAGWAGFHALRHTFASLQLAEGVNLVQLSRALGHHSAAFTLTVYVHLLEGDQAPPLDLSAKLANESEQFTATPIKEESTDGYTVTV